MMDRKRCAACGVPLPGDTVWCFPCRHSEPTQDEPAAGVGPETHVDKAVAWDMRQKALVGERAAGFAEGVEAAAAWHDARAKLAAAPCCSTPPASASPADLRRENHRGGWGSPGRRPVFDPPSSRRDPRAPRHTPV